MIGLWCFLVLIVVGMAAVSSEVFAVWQAAGLHGAPLQVASMVTVFVLMTAALHVPRFFRWLRGRQEQRGRDDRARKLAAWWPWRHP